MRTERISLFFGLSYSSFLVLPRVLMEQMPDDWQVRFVDLMDEMQEEFPGLEQIEPGYEVNARGPDGRFVELPEYLCRYRHPDYESIAALRGKEAK